MVDDLHGLGSIFGCEVVEHDAIHAFGQCLIEFLEVAYLHLDLEVLALLLAILLGTADGIVDAAREIDMVVLEQNHIKKTDAMVATTTDLDSLLTSDEFADSITEDPVTLEITDTGSDFDIAPGEFAITEAASYGISQLICAAIQFQMDIQILRWYAAYNSELFGITGNLWWEASSWTDKLGLWYIELTDSVFQVPQGCPSKPLELDDSSDTDPVYEIGLALANTVSAFLECIEGVYVDLPHDMQGELNSLIRSLKETRDMQLRRAM